MARVLLAERDQRICAFIAGILIEFGHDVAVCANSAEASAWLATEPVDVVLTDLVLCGPHGARCGKSWAALGIPTITLSGREFHAEDPVPQRPAPLVDKPFRFADLERALTAVANCSRAAGGLHCAVRTAA